MERNLKALISEMTLEEKAGLCSGQDFWHLKGVERLGIPSVMVSDGPHGLRKQDDKADHLGMNESIEAVCFPAACATACSFDRELLQKMGSALGKECQAENVSVLLGPAVNIKRSPLCGRNFEYFSEDPYLASEMAAAHIEGVQSENVGTSLKHFAANNQEYKRMTCSSEIDERTFREIYLSAFEGAVKKAKPYTVMCAYNKVNGVYASENHRLLTEILRDEWGFEGFVMSDWGAVNNRVKGLLAGLELEMPSSGGETDAQLVEAVQSGKLQVSVLDSAVEKILRIIFKCADGRQTCTFDRNKDHELAAQIAQESMVLLKNDHILPLSQDSRLAFIGEFAVKPRFQGGGSSHIHASKWTGAYEAASAIADVTYAKGYRTDKDETDEALLEEAVCAAKAADAAVVFAGLPDAFESEGYDRKHMRMPDCQNRLINAVCSVQPNTVVVLHNGSPVEMPWIHQVKGVLEAYLGGQAVGTAAVRLLFGLANPCGKLAETFPLRLEDNPSYLYFPGNSEKSEYREGVFVGYRYYDKKAMDVLFPFGYGLSYTNYAYSNLKLGSHKIKDTQTLTVSVDVTNTGHMAGKEIVQLYVSDKTGSANRPPKELKDFVKVYLEPGETKTVTMTLNKRSFAWYNTKISDWYAADGSYDILIGKSSREIVLTDTVELESTAEIPFVADYNTPLGDLLQHERTRPIIRPYVDEVLGTLGGGSEVSKEAISDEMNLNMIKDAPLRTLKSFIQITGEALEALLSDLNR